jgi:KaiC/GvpD/RAD55 family RecA-like ATPase
MTQTATPTLDDVLGGVLPGRIHLITGMPGSGKTAACLHFLKTGAIRRERPVLLTRDRGADLRSIALYVGVDLHGLVRDRRVTLIRYRPRFPERLVETATPAAIMDELRRTLELDDLAKLAGPDTPLRIAIDPVSPFVPSADVTGAALDALTEWLESNNATALVTWTGDMAIGIDRRLEPLVDRAAMIVNLERVARASFRAHVIRARHPIASAGPIPFQIVPGLGVATTPIAVLQQTFGGDATGAGGEQPAA